MKMSNPKTTRRRSEGSGHTGGEGPSGHQLPIDALRQAIQQGSYHPTNLDIARSWALIRDLVGSSADRIPGRWIAG